MFNKLKNLFRDNDRLVIDTVMSEAKLMKVRSTLKKESDSLIKLMTKNENELKKVEDLIGLFNPTP